MDVDRLFDVVAIEWKTFYEYPQTPETLGICRHIKLGRQYATTLNASTKLQEEILKPI